MPVMALNNINIIPLWILGIHFGYTFCQSKVLSPVLAGETNSSSFYIILR